MGGREAWRSPAATGVRLFTRQDACAPFPLIKILFCIVAACAGAAAPMTTPAINNTVRAWRNAPGARRGRLLGISMIKLSIYMNSGCTVYVPPDAAKPLADRHIAPLPPVPFCLRSVLSHTSHTFVPCGRRPDCARERTSGPGFALRLGIQFQPHRGRSTRERQRRTRVD